MSNGDILGLILSYVYAFGLLIIVETIGKKLSWEQDLTRKIIHIGEGCGSGEFCSFLTIGILALSLLLHLLF